MTSISKTRKKLLPPLIATAIVTSQISVHPAHSSDKWYVEGDTPPLSSAQGVTGVTPQGAKDLDLYRPANNLKNDADKLTSRLTSGAGSQNANSAARTNTGRPGIALKDILTRARSSAGAIDKSRIVASTDNSVAQAMANTGAMRTNGKAALEQLRSAAANPAEVKVKKSRNGASVRVTGEFLLPSGGSRGERVTAFFDQNRSVFGLSKDVTLTASESCSSRLCFVRLNKIFSGLPVFGDELVATVDDNDQIRSISGSSAPINPSIMPTTRRMPLPDLEARALGVIGHSGATWKETKTIEGVRRGEDGQYRHVYRVTVAATPTEVWDIFLDVSTGEVVDKLSRVYDQSFVNSSGTDLSGATQSFRSQQQSGGIYFLVDDSFPANSQSVFIDFENRTDAPVYVASSSNNSGWDPAGVSALKNSQLSYEYYLNNFGRKGIDDANGEMLGGVHYDQNLVNAFYADVDGGVMIYGDGDGVISSNLAGALDIAGHEMTHGVVARTAGLEYRYQSGALNESFADFFGAQIDPDDWLIGEDVWLQGNCGGGEACLRNLADPTQAFSVQPAHMDDYQALPLDVDKGGVHINSGIPNKAMYMLAEGLGTSSIGRALASDLAYDTLLGLSPTSDFQDAVETMYQIASVAYPAGTADSVEAAWASVGLFVASSGPGGTPGAPIKPSEVNAIAYLYSGDSGLSYSSYVQAVADTAPAYLVDYDAYSVLDVALQRASLAPTASDQFLDGYFTASITPSGDIDFGFFTREPDGVWEQSTSYGLATLNNGSYSSVSLSPNYANDGRLAYTVDYLPTVFFSNNSEIGVLSVDITGPTYTEDGSNVADVVAVDSLRWDPTGRKVAIDFLACLPLTEGQPVDEQLCYWSIAVVNSVTGAVSYPFAAQDPYVDLGYPSFSNLSDGLITFDAHFYDPSQGSLAAQLVYVVDIYSGAGVPALSSRGACTASDPTTWSSPSFSSDDGGLIYAECQTGSSDAVPTANYYFDASTSSKTRINDYHSALPSSIPALPYYFDGALVPNQASMSFGSIPWGSSKTIEGLCLENPVTAASEVFGYLSAEGVTTTIYPAVFQPGASACGSVSVAPPTSVTAGNYQLYLVFATDIVSQPTFVTLNVTVAPVAPATPSIVSVTSNGSDSLLVAFTIANTGGDSNVTYEAQCGEQTVIGDSSPLTVTNLDPGSEYSCVVTATNSAGSSTSSAIQAETDPQNSNLLLLLPALCETANPPAWCP